MEYLRGASSPASCRRLEPPVPDCPPERSPLKLVIGIVRPEKANDVLEALYKCEVSGLSITRVQGHGGELDQVQTYRGTTVKMELSDKVRFDIAVSDDFVDTTITALCDGASAGNAEVVVVDRRDEAIEWVKQNVGPGDVVLYENDVPDHYP